MLYDDREDRRREKEKKKALKSASPEERQKAAEAEKLYRRRDEYFASPWGQARNAKLSGLKYFQIELPIDSTYQTGYSKAVANVKAAMRSHGGQGAALTYIEMEGRELVQAGFVFKESGQVSRDKFLSSGQQVMTTGATYGIYLFKATDEPARTDEPWRNTPE